MDVIRAGAPSRGQAGVEVLRPCDIKGQGWGLLGDMRKKKEKVDWGSPEEACKA